MGGSQAKHGILKFIAETTVHGPGYFGGSGNEEFQRRLEADRRERKEKRLTLYGNPIRKNDPAALKRRASNARSTDL